MCILFVYRNPNATEKSYRLIIATNRDEYFNRSARPAEYWPDHPGCLGGRDCEVGKEGGTWFALSVPRGRAGIILNLHEDGKSSANDSGKKGRGFLVSDYLTSDVSTETHLNNLHRENHQDAYNPYSLILVDLKSTDVYYANNAKHSTGPRLCSEKVLAFGNTTPDNPYKKVEAGKEKFEKITNNVDSETIDQSKLVDDLFALLKWKKRHLPDAQLEKRYPETYEAQSSVCVCEEGGIYGTRTHSILLLEASGKMTFYEETFTPDTASWELRKFQDFIPK